MASLLDTGALVSSRYRLDRKLGQGGMGVVWRATDLEEDRPVALKFLSSTEDEVKRRDLQLRLRREARAASAVDHANLCRIFDVLELEDGSPAIVMEYLEGESLAARIDRVERLELAELAPIFLQILAGVNAVHARGIIHRDLKPENVFLVEGTGATTVKVLDFGIAKLTATEGEALAGTALTASGAVLGTPCFMSPEQFGERHVDLRTDVWSLGLIAYHCLSGVLPTRGGNIFEVFRSIVDRPVQPIEEIVPGLPSDVSTLVGRMLERKREARPSDLAEVIDVFAAHASGRVSARTAAAPASARPVDPLATTYGADTPPARLQVPSEAPPLAHSAPAPAAPRSRVGVAAAAAVALVTIGGLALGSRRAGEARPSPTVPVPTVSSPSTRGLAVVAADPPAATAAPSEASAAPPQSFASAAPAASARPSASSRGRVVVAASSSAARAPAPQSPAQPDDGLVKEPPF